MHTPHSPEPHGQIICPNCGFAADHNYCAQCGQETRLHDDTFWALILHFVGHYFHYDSKFWKTLSTMWLKPGELTLAYLRKQRMRYIPPISLYIFISFVFFLAALSVRNGTAENRSSLHELRGQLDSADQKILDQELKGRISLDSIRRAEIAVGQDAKVTIDTASSGALGSFFQKKWDKLRAEHGEETGKYLKENIVHNFPKIFFFLIPVVAFFLKVLFIRRKSALFVHHAVFSLHVHSFFFSILLLSYINPFRSISAWLGLLIFIWGGLYFLLAMRRVYAIGMGRALLYAFLISFGYFIAFALGLIAVLLIALTM